MQKKPYEAPRTTKTDVELEQGFMNASVYQTKENTKALDIEDQEVQSFGEKNPFDFREEDSWGNN